MGKKKKNVKNSVPSYIASAILPAAAFTATPNIQPPAEPLEEFGTGVTTALLRSSVLTSLFAIPTPPNDNMQSDDESPSSLADYAEPGFFDTMNRSRGGRRHDDDDDDDLEEFENEIVNDHYDDHLAEEVVQQESVTPLHARPVSSLYAKVHKTDSLGRRKVLNAEETDSTPTSSRRDLQIARGLDETPTVALRKSEHVKGSPPMVKRTVGHVESTHRTLYGDEDMSTTDRGALQDLAAILRENESRADAEERDSRRKTRTKHSRSAVQGGNDQVRQLQDDIRVLQTTVQRLNAELSARKTPSSGRHISPQGGLPGKGPAPPWLLNTRFVTPLLAAYDDKLDAKDKLISHYMREIQKFRNEVNEVVRENERLHIKLEEMVVSGSDSATRADWQNLTSQACLVLEENQLLLDKLTVTQERSNCAAQAHAVDLARVTKQCSSIEAEKGAMESELLRLNHKLRDLRTEHDELMRTTEGGEMQRTAEAGLLKTQLEESRITHSRELQETLQQLEQTQTDKKQLSEKVADLQADKKRLEIETKGYKKNLKELHRKNTLLQRLLKQSHGAQEYLDTVVQMADAVAAERDTYAAAVQMKDQEFSKVVSNLIEEVKVKAAVDPLGKEPEHSGKKKIKDKVKLEKMVERLLKQLEEEKTRCSDQEREVHYLQSLIRDKDAMIERVEAEKRTLEEQLEVVWQAAVNDNVAARTQLAALS